MTVTSRNDEGLVTGGAIPAPMTRLDSSAARREPDFMSAQTSRLFLRRRRFALVRSDALILWGDGFIRD